mgnify:FL=1
MLLGRAPLAGLRAAASTFRFGAPRQHVREASSRTKQVRRRNITASLDALRAARVAPQMRDSEAERSVVGKAHERQPTRAELALEADRKSSAEFVDTLIQEFSQKARVQSSTTKPSSSSLEEQSQDWPEQHFTVEPDTHELDGRTRKKKKSRRRTTKSRAPSQNDSARSEITVPTLIKHLRRRRHKVAQYSDTHLQQVEEAMIEVAADPSTRSILRPSDIAALVKQWAMRGNLEHASSIVAQSRSQFHVAVDVSGMRALMRGYCASGQMDAAQQIVDEHMPAQGLRPHGGMLNDLVSGWARVGNMQKALDVVVNDMPRNGTSPNTTTLNAIVSGWVAQRQFDEAEAAIWDVPRRHHEAQPDARTFEILVRGYMRVGNMERAADALVRTCRDNHSESDLLKHIPVSLFNRLIGALSNGNPTFGRAADHDLAQVVFEALLLAGKNPTDETWKAFSIDEKLQVRKFSCAARSLLGGVILVV